MGVGGGYVHGGAERRGVQAVGVGGGDSAAGN